MTLESILGTLLILTIFILTFVIYVHDAKKNDKEEERKPDREIFFEAVMKSLLFTAPFSFLFYLFFGKK